MKSLYFRWGIALCLLAISVLSAFAADSRLVADYHSRKKVFRVYAEGRIEQVFPPEKPTDNDSINQISISPDQQKIAYVKDHDLWVYDVAQRQSTQLTRVGRPYTEEFASVEVVIKLWSQEGVELLYAVVGGDAEDPEGMSPDLKSRAAEYGLYLLSLASGKSRPAKFLEEQEEPVAWRKNGDFILIRDDVLMRYHPATGSMVVIASQPFSLYQSILAENGRAIFASADASKRMKASQLVEVSLEDGSIKYWTAPGPWAEYQWPTPSPDGKRLAYLHRFGASRFPQLELVVDGRVLHSYEGYGRMHWLNDMTLALVAAYSQEKGRSPARELLIFDVATGALKGKHPWEN